MLISQEHFDEVVSENMEDFGMSFEEACQDAVKQLEKQGYDLSCVATTEISRRNSAIIESIISRINSLIHGGEHEELQLRLSELYERATLGDEESRYAGTLGAVGASCYVCTKFIKHRTCTLRAISLLRKLFRQTHNRELLPSPGALAILSALKEYDNDEEMIYNGLDAISTSILQSEKNKRDFHKAGINELLIRVFEHHFKSRRVIRVASLFLRRYVSDDDRREGVQPATFSRARELCEDMDSGLLPHLLSLLQHPEHDSEYTSDLLLTIKSVAVNDVICKNILAKKGLESSLERIRASISNPSVARNGCAMIKSIARNDEIKTRIGKGEGLAIILQVMEVHIKTSTVVEQGLAALSVLSLRQPENCKIISSTGSIQLIVAAMEGHPEIGKVQRQAIATLRNLVSDWRNNDLVDKILDEGVEQLIRKARSNHPECEEVAYAALRDLKLSYH